MRGTHGFELAFQISRESILPEPDLVLELGGCDSESLRSDVDGLYAVLVREEDQRSGKVVQKQRFTSGNLCQYLRVYEREARGNAQS